MLFTRFLLDKTPRLLALAFVSISVAGCASSSHGAASPRMLCEDQFSAVFVAAQGAVIRLGAKVTHANRASGTILGRVEADDLGFRADLSITLSRIPENQPGNQETITVTVRATESGVSDPGPERAADLRHLENRYLSLVSERTTCGEPY